MLFSHLPPGSEAMNMKPAQGAGWKPVRNAMANFRMVSSHAAVTVHKKVPAYF